MTEHTPGLSGTQEYYIALITEERGNISGMHWFEHRQLGNVLWLFSSVEEIEKFRDKYLDENQAFMDVLERDFDQLRRGAEDINFFRKCTKQTLPDLLPFLFDVDIDALILDPGSEGWQKRTYKSPNKIYEEDPTYFDRRKEDE